MKVLRVVGVFVIAIVGLLALAVGVLYALFDGDKIKAEISRTVLEQKQRTLVIAGQPQLSVWPNVGIQLDGITLSERGSQEEFAALKSARISVALMPLLRKQVQVRTLDVDGLQLTLIKNKDGSLNIADLLGQDAAKSAHAPAQAAHASAEPVQLDVSAIRLANAQLVWCDDPAGTRTEVSNLSLSTGAVRANTASQTASVERLLLTIQGKAGADAFALSLDAPKISLSPAQSNSEALTLSATLNGAARSATVNVRLSGVQGNAEQLKIANLAIKLDARAGESSVKGQLSSPVAVDVAQQALTLSQLAGTLELASPAMPMKHVTLPLQGALQFHGKAKTVALDLRTQLDESNIALRVKESTFSPLALAFDLDIDKLNVDKYLPPKPAAAAPGKEGAAGKEAPIDLSALKGQTANGTIRIGALQVSNLKLEKINAKLALAGGKLDVAPLSLKLYGGSTNGSFSVNANGNAVAVKQNLVGIRINPLMTDLLHKDLLEGKGNVVLDIATRGETVSAMKKALGGTASLALKDGAVKGINLAQTLRDVKAKLGQADSTQAANANQQTDFSELSASFKIANGVARNDDLAMKSPFIRLGGAGDIDVGASQMNYLAKATVVASGEGQGGKDLGELKGLTVPVRLSGPFDALRYKIEFGAMLEGATKAKLEEKTQAIKAKAEEVVKDKAKELFKGLLGK